MPRALFRLLAVLLLALTIPVQGMAAVTAGQCMAFGHHQDGAGQDDHAHEHDADESGTEQSHCGPCTACCASASIAGPAGVSLLCSLSNTKHVFSQLPPPGVQPDGLDRPPLAL